MTIQKGRQWGGPGSLPPGAPVVGSDAELRAVVETARRGNSPIGTVGLTAGDLCRTVGGPAGLTLAFPVDAGAVLVDGRLHWFVAHLVARTRTWSHAVVAMNAQWRGDWQLGPKAHPNDGLIDTYEARLGVADRLKARRRLPTGSHLPHPAIRLRRVPAVQYEFARPVLVELDGQPAGQARHLSIRVEADAYTLVV